jgi:hypothetical protein
MKYRGIDVESVGQVKRVLLKRLGLMLLAVNLFIITASYLTIENKWLIVVLLTIVNGLMGVPTFLLKRVAQIEFDTTSSQVIIKYFMIISELRTCTIPYANLQMQYKKENVERGVFVWVLRIMESKKLKFKIPQQGYWSQKNLDDIFLSYEKEFGNER